MSPEHFDPSKLEASAALELPAKPTSAKEARRFISQFCAAADLPEELCQTAALLTSEVVTNAVLHGRTRATLRVQEPPPYLRVAVEDANPDLPEIGDAPELGSASGRGMHIVAALADRWGIEATPTGKAVWFELDMPGA